MRSFTKKARQSPLDSEGFEAQRFERIIAEIKYDASEVFGALKTPLLKFPFGAQPEIANCIAMLSCQLVSVLEAITFKPSTSTSVMRAAAVGTAPSMPAG